MATQRAAGQVLIRPRQGLGQAIAAGRGIMAFARRKPLGAIGAAIFIVLCLMAILAPVISPHSPYKTNTRAIYAAPSSKYPLGTDQLGRDVLSRLYYGARISLLVGVATVGLGIGFGSLLGIVSAQFGGIFDLLVQRLIDAFIAFPAIILGLTIMAVLGASVTNVIIALVFVLAPGAVRAVRAQALSVKELDYILSARAIGCSSGRIIFRHMLPNCAAVVIVLVTITLGFAIVVEASLSFLGVGIPPKVPSWGSMLADGASSVDVAPWLAIMPGVFLAAVVFAVNLLGDALRDVLDPKLRGR